MWNCSRISQRADDECATVNISFAYLTWDDCFMGVAEIIRVFFVSGAYDFEWKSIHRKDALDVSDLIEVFINVDARVEVSFERIVENEFFKFGYEKDQYEDFSLRTMVKLLSSVHQTCWSWDRSSKEIENPVILQP